MSKKDEALKLALDFAIMHHTDAGYTEVRYAVQSALRVALASQGEALAEQPAQQEPVATAYFEKITGRIVPPDDTHRRKFPMCYRPLVFGDTSPQPAQPLPPEWYAQWIRNNYQDHPNIATLCDEMTRAAHGIKEKNT